MTVMHMHRNKRGNTYIHVDVETNVVMSLDAKEKMEERKKKKKKED